VRTPAAILSLLVLASGTAACGREPASPASLCPARRWSPLEEGRRWTYEATQGTERLRIAYVALGGDVRRLPDARDVSFRFVYGTPEGFDHEAAKSIYALAPAAPRLFYLDAMLWGVQFDPPVPMLPEAPTVGAAWEWSGSLDVDREARRTHARIEVEALEAVVVPAGTFETLRVRQRHDPGPIEVTSWYAKDVGLVRFELWEGDAREPDLARRLVLLEHSAPPSR
jgi:hypothetical protein